MYHKGPLSTILDYFLTQIFALKKSKKLDPIKTSILQPLRDANFLGPSTLQD
jgi:hypothetical protein